METRIPASDRTSQKINELLTDGVAAGDARAELVKLAVREIVEEALEAEVTEAVGLTFPFFGVGSASPIAAGVSGAAADIV